MNLLRKIVIHLIFIALIGMVFHVMPALADEGHSHPEEKMDMKMDKGMKMDMDMDMDMHQHAPIQKKGPELPPGTKEVKINLSGPFCHKHPDEITAGLMKLDGVIHIEAFSGRRYILAHFNGEKVTPEEMAVAISGLKGSGWRCTGTVSTKKRTER